MTKVDVIILAGGLGTRLRAVVPNVPKPLARIGERPFLDILLDYLDRSAVVGKVVLTVGHQADQIMERYKKSTYHFPIEFSVEETLLGTGGAVKQALASTLTPDILVLNGDTFAGVDLDELLAVHKEKGGVATIATSFEDDASRYGTLALGADDAVTAFKEKEAGSSGYVNVGTYVFNRPVFDAVPAGTPISLERDVLPLLAHTIYAYRHTDGFIDIGTPESYAAAEAYLKQRF